MKELDDLKATWQNSSSATTSGASIQSMTKVGKHPTLRRLRFKFLMEILGVTAFLLLFQDGFDAAAKPLYANLALILGASLLLLNDALGYLFLIRPVSGDSLSEQLQNSLQRTRSLALSSTISAGAFGLGILLFFTSSIQFDTTKYLILAGMIATLLIALFISTRIWNRRITSIKNSLNEFHAV